MYILNLTKDCNTKDYSENVVRTFAISDEPDFTAPVIHTDPQMHKF